MLFVASQNSIDLKNKVEMGRRDQSIRHNLRHKILEYVALKNALGLGHIQCKFETCSKYCPKRFRPGHDENCSKVLMILGHYRDTYELTKDSVYLGHSYKHAHAHKKGFKSRKRF